MGLARSPQKIVRQLVATVQAMGLRIDELSGELRTAQEATAEKQLARQDYTLVLLHRDGFCEVWAEEWRPVRVECLHDLGRDRHDLAVEWICHRLPRPYSELLHTDKGKVIATGNASGCLDRNGFELLMRRMEEVYAVRQLEKDIAAPIAATPST